MECNDTFTDRRRASAFTLMEMLVAGAISGVMLTAKANMPFFTGRSFVALMNYSELDRYSRNALDQMIYKVRQADELTSYATNQLVSTYLGTNRLSYVYSPTTKTLTETVGDQSKVLLTGCDMLNFSVFQSNTA